MNARKYTYLVYNPVNTRVVTEGGIPRRYYELPVRITQDESIAKAYPPSFIVLIAPPDDSQSVGYRETTVEAMNL